MPQRGQVPFPPDSKKWAVAPSFLAIARRACACQKPRFACESA